MQKGATHNRNVSDTAATLLVYENSKNSAILGIKAPKVDAVFASLFKACLEENRANLSLEIGGIDQWAGGRNTVLKTLFEQIVAQIGVGCAIRKIWIVAGETERECFRQMFNTNHQEENYF